MPSALVTSVEGPKGKAEIFEHVVEIGSGGQRFEYEVQFQGGSQKVLALGEAYIIAKELSGVGG